MVIYNITFVLEEKIIEHWFAKGYIHITTILDKSEYTESYTLLKVLNNDNNPNPIYALHVNLESLSKIPSFEKNELLNIKEKMTRMYNEDCMSIETVLKPVF